MKYEEWLKLTDEEMEQIPDEELPEVPTELLSNGIVKSVAKRVNGELGWEMTQTRDEGEDDTSWIPKFRSQVLRAASSARTVELTVWYRLDETSGLAVPIEEREPSEEEEPLGKYARRWKAWMEDVHPELVDWMCHHGMFLTTARSVEMDAREYQAILDKEYQRNHPRPHDFNETVNWEQNRAYEIDSAVMREVVLKPQMKPSEKYLESISR